MYNLSSYCGLVDAKIRTSDKDLPVKLAKRLFVVRNHLKQRGNHGKGDSTISAFGKEYFRTSEF